jgi:pilus assembly protein Flp/PilA
VAISRFARRVFYRSLRLEGLPMNAYLLLTALKSEDGATAVEYAVLLALILVALISAITSVGNSTSGLWQNDVNQITNATTGS